MKKLIILAAAFLVAGCAQITGLIPSFWDDNQSHKIVDLRLKIERLDCTQPQRAQVAGIRDDLEWFKLYSESKGRRQNDVVKLTEPMRATAEEWYQRVSAAGYKENPTYCQLKRQVMSAQAARAATAVLGRF